MRRKLVEGYRVGDEAHLRCEAYYERVKLYLSRTQPKPQKRARGEKATSQPWMTRDNMRALVTSIVRQGVFGRLAVELLEVSCGRGDALSALLWRGHDAGGDGVSLPGDDAEAFEGDGCGGGAAVGAHCRG